MGEILKREFAYQNGGFLEIWNHALRAALDHVDENRWNLPLLGIPNAAYALVGLQARLLRETQPTNLQLQTWRSKTSRLTTIREFEFTDGGQPIAEISTNWGVFDLENRKLLPIPEQLRSGTLPQKFPFKVQLKRGTAIERVDQSREILVEKSDVDGNDHTNNQSYFRFALEAFGQRQPREIEAIFGSETRLGDRLELRIQQLTEHSKGSDFLAFFYQPNQERPSIQLLIRF